MIKLDNNYSIKVDTHSFYLQYSYTKKIDEKIKNKLTGKFEKTGKKVEKQFFDYWYFPTIKMCLERYIKETLKETENIKKTVSLLESIDKTIDSLPKIYVKEGKLMQL